uniref:Uncharacterized protein n=1 Tax=Rhizophora mucronata TaxID=61149 RepID=A0A2P2QNK9_RHIMU
MFPDFSAYTKKNSKFICFNFLHWSCGNSNFQLILIVLLVLR